jgi:uncharacterized protein (TIGR03435 family)
LTNLGLNTLIHLAYAQSPTAELERVPPWLTTERYDVVITGPFQEPREQQQAALRALLAERLKLVAHSEVHTEPSFDLVLARGDGRLGAVLEPSVCSGSAAVSASDTSRIPTPDEAMTRCGWWAPDGTLYSGGLSMEMLANWLQGQVRRRVTDRTGIKEFHAVKWEFRSNRPGGSPEPNDLIVRLERDLGLTLRPSITDVEVVVIDHIERPSEN